MTNIIGPINKKDWYTMSTLRGSISYYKENNITGLYSKAIEKETSIYNKYLDKYTKLS